MQMGDEYAKLGRRWRRPATRGFRLSPARLSVRRLRARLWTLLGLLGRYVRNVRLLSRGLVASAGGRRRALPAGGKDGGAAAARAGAGPGQAAAATGGKARRPPPCMRSNSFYARAVAECLEFIKGSNAAPSSPSPAAAPRPLLDQRQMPIKVT